MKSYFSLRLLIFTFAWNTALVVLAAPCVDALKSENQFTQKIREKDATKSDVHVYQSEEGQLRVVSEKLKWDKTIVTKANIVGLSLSPNAERLLVFYSNRMAIFDLVFDAEIFYKIVTPAVVLQMNAGNTYVEWNDDHQFILYRKGFLHQFVEMYWEKSSMEDQLIFIAKDQAQRINSFHTWDSIVLFMGNQVTTRIDSPRFSRGRQFSMKLVSRLSGRSFFLPAPAPTNAWLSLPVKTK